MRFGRNAVLLFLLALPLVLASSAGALDLCEEPHCQPPAAEQNTFYEWEFEAEEGCIPYTFTFINGTLPNGLEVTADGELEGTPTEAGTFDFWVALDDNGGPDNPACLIKGEQSQAHFFLTVMRDLAVTTSSLPLARPGEPYSAQLEFSNPEQGWRVVWDIVGGSLPAGLTLSESGLISGTPTGAGSSTVVVRAREPFRRFGERTLTLNVVTALQANASFGPAEVGIRYAASVAGSGGAAPLSYAVLGSLPAGLTLDSATGAVTGVPRVAGTFPVQVGVTDAAGQTATVSASLRVAGRLAIRTSRLRAARVGDAYSVRLRSSGGVAPKKWTILRGSLPRGLRLSSATGTLAGTPRQAGRYRVTVQVRDRLGARSTTALRLAVRR